MMFLFESRSPGLAIAIFVTTNFIVPDVVAIVTLVILDLLQKSENTLKPSASIGVASARYLRLLYDSKISAILSNIDELTPYQYCDINFRALYKNSKLAPQPA
ncbi:MAG: hypothetical protein ABI262_00425 [Microcoleus sp.]